MRRPWGFRLLSQQYAGRVKVMSQSGAPRFRSSSDSPTRSNASHWTQSTCRAAKAHPSVRCARKRSLPTVPAQPDPQQNRSPMTGAGPGAELPFPAQLLPPVLCTSRNGVLKASPGS